MLGHNFPAHPWSPTPPLVGSGHCGNCSSVLLITFQIPTAAGAARQSALQAINHEQPTMNSTVKRKFNALVQGIGSRPSTAASDRGDDIDDSMADLASSPASQRSSPHPSIRVANDELLNKKRRVGAATMTPTKYGTPAQSSPASIRTVTTISNVTLRKWTPGSASPGGVPGPAADGQDGRPPPPKYCPGDREQLLRRLATFQELTDWTPKPDRVNEIEWAKRGWVCQGRERVKCTLCGRELVVRVNRKEVDGKEISVLIASEIAESVVDKYAELIVEAHAEDCLWRKKGCDGEWNRPCVRS